MEIPHRAGQGATVFGAALLALGSVANPILMPIHIVGVYGAIRGLRIWNALDSDSTLWTGVAVGCSTLITLFALFSGSTGWLIWTSVATAMLSIGMFGARHHVARRHRQWRVHRQMTSTVGNENPAARAPKHHS